MFEVTYLTHSPRNFEVINCLNAELIYCLTKNSRRHPRFARGHLLATSAVNGLNNKKMLPTMLFYFHNQSETNNYFSRPNQLFRNSEFPIMFQKN